MAKRPLFIANEMGSQFISIKEIEFEWFPGFSVTQKQKSIESFHREATKLTGIKKILEISTKAPNKLGVSLSAFNLMITTVKKEKTFSVESAFQASKVFQNGGPYTDILYKNSFEAKKDERLKNSGKIIGFNFFNQSWDSSPKTAFYDWLYINALAKYDEYVDDILQYSAFTDISFNPEKSLNCQARSAALFISLFKRNLITPDILQKDRFLQILENQEINYDQNIFNF